ncbi:hypothetical protein AsAng_0062800 [Aureispira anguillae]|uniref:Uncharacterized protein n=1 Tax=Aureispira anguillae TaxID=2864201 RepID=A0A915YM59_9BACT|nr:hypothetical protein AsAng_0062800 [Aureispira anguillae]
MVRPANPTTVFNRRFNAVESYELLSFITNFSIRRNYYMYFTNLCGGCTVRDKAYLYKQYSVNFLLFS